MELSDDELKVVVGLLLQLNFKLADAAVVLPIVAKLQKGIKEPELKPEGEAKTTEEKASDITL